MGKSLLANIYPFSASRLTIETWVIPHRAHKLKQVAEWLFQTKKEKKIQIPHRIIPKQIKRSILSKKQITYFSIRHCKYIFERWRHLSDLCPEDLRQLIYSFFSWSHKCMWSKGKTPFSGGTGLTPLFPPNAPPAKQNAKKSTLSCKLHVQGHCSSLQA